MSWPEAFVYVGVAWAVAFAVWAAARHGWGFSIEFDDPRESEPAETEGEASKQEKPSGEER